MKKDTQVFKVMTKGSVKTQNFHIKMATHLIYLRRQVRFPLFLHNIPSLQGTFESIENGGVF